jgi:hypothetical protein
MSALFLVQTLRQRLDSAALGCNQKQILRYAVLRSE